MEKGPYGGPPGEFLFLLTDGILPLVLFVSVLAYLAFRVSRGISTPSGEGRRTGAALIEALSVLAVGVLISLFVGFGIEAFYPSPEFPEPPEFRGSPPELESREEAKEEFRENENEFQQELESYEAEVSRYNRVAAPVAVGIAVLILASVFFLRRTGIPTIRDGIALGGVLTLFYGLSLALQAEGDVFKFLMVTVTLLVVLAAVYLRSRGQEG